MAMTVVEYELRAVLGLVQGEKEPRQKFLERLMAGADELPDEEWDQFTLPVKSWLNSEMAAYGNHLPLQEFEGELVAESKEEKKQKKKVKKVKKDPPPRESKVEESDDPPRRVPSPKKGSKYIVRKNVAMDAWELALYILVPNPDMGFKDFMEEFIAQNRANMTLERSLRYKYKDFQILKRTVKRLTLVQPLEEVGVIDEVDE